MKRRIIHDGGTKTIFAGTESGTIIQYFKDDTKAFNTEHRDLIAGKGVLNNRISAHLMNKLEKIGIPTHFIRSLNMREQLVHEVDVLPIQIQLRNIASGSLCQQFGLKKGEYLSQPLLEFYMKGEDGKSKLLSENHIYAFNWSDPYELEEVIHLSYRINDYLCGLFAGINMQLVDIKLEFGRLWGEYGELYLMLADEISPDTCTLWNNDEHEQKTTIEAYQTVAKGLKLVPEGGIIQGGDINEALAESLEDIENEQAKKRKLKVVKRPVSPPTTKPNNEK